MAAVLRVKRHLQEEPQEAFVIACKRKKTEDVPELTVFKFAGTVQTPEEKIVEQVVNNFKKDNLKSSWRHVPDISGKLRAEHKKISQDSRYQIVKCYRALNDSSILETESPTNNGKSLDKTDCVTVVVDVINNLDTKTDESKVEIKTDKDEKNFVYDLYYTNAEDIDDALLDNMVSVQAMNTEFVYDYEKESDSSAAGDDSDSNDENNWRNDYPDSDHSVTEDDMILATQMDGVKIDENNELSSDDGEEDFVYGNDVNPRDIKLYGESYAHYKARMKKELELSGSEEEDNFYSSSHSDEEQSNVTA